MTTARAVAKLQEQFDELSTTHDKAKDLAWFARYADDPVGFMRDVLRCEPWERQEAMALAVRDEQRTVVVTSNGIGKDWVSARIALWWIYARRGFVILTGPTERQVKQICMREVRRAFNAAPELPGELLSLELRVDAAGSCGMIAFTSDNADKLVGYHHPRLLICVTEGQGVEDDAYEAAMACVTSPENRLYVYGNPTKPIGSFYRVAHSEHWHRLTIAATEHPNVITGREEIPGAVSRQWIDDMRNEYGENSSIFQARVHARFPEDNIEGLIRRAWYRAAVERHEAAGTGFVSNEPQRAVLALDIARYGADSSCLCTVRGARMDPLVTWRDASITDSARRIIDHAMHCTVRGQRPALIVDETGLGAGCVDILRSEGWPVIGFNGAGGAFNSERFLNCRAESHWLLRDLLERNRIGLPRDAALEEEALAIEWQLTASGQIQIVGKETVRKTLGRSPDRLDAVVMALWYLHQPQPVWGNSQFRSGARAERSTR